MPAELYIPAAAEGNTGGCESPWHGCWGSISVSLEEQDLVLNCSAISPVTFVRDLRSQLTLRIILSLQNCLNGFVYVILRRHLSKQFILALLIVLISIFPNVRMCIMGMKCPWRSEESRVNCFKKLGLQVVMSLHMGAGTVPASSGRIVLLLLSHIFNPVYAVFKNDPSPSKYLSNENNLLVVTCTTKWAKLLWFPKECWCLWIMQEQEILLQGKAYYMKQRDRNVQRNCQ